MQDKVFSIISEIIGVDQSTLNPNSGPNNVKAWDSLAMLSIISAIESKFDIEYGLDDILSLNVIQDIFDFIGDSVVDRNDSPYVINEKRTDSELDLSGLFRPDKVVFGNNSINELQNFVSDSILLVLGSGEYSNTLSKKVEELVKDRCTSITILNKEKGEPSDYKVSKIMNKLDIIPDTIIGIGGGSVIDTCKLIYTKLLNPNNDLLDWQQSFSLPKPEIKIDLISIPTTHGSGAETSSAVAFNSSLSYKTILLSHQYISKYVIYDGKLLLDLPFKIAFDTTLDAFTHSIEGYLSKLENKQTYPLVLESLQLIIKNFNSDYKLNSEDAKNELLRASYLSGIVQNHCSTGLSHSISHQLSRFDIGHGRLNAIVLPEVLKFNYHNSNEKLDKLSKDLGLVDGKDLIKWLDNLNGKNNIGNLSENSSQKIVISDSLINDIFNDITYSTTPFEIEKPDLEAMLEYLLIK